MKTITTLVTLFAIVMAQHVKPAKGDERDRIAVMETAFGKQADASSIQDAAAAGYRAIQMHSGMPAAIRKKPIDSSLGLAIGSNPEILDAWKRESEKHGVEIVSLCAGSLNRCQIWDQDREVAMRIAKQTVDACHHLGVKVMLFPFFGPSKFQESDEALAGVADFMRDFLPYAAAKNVVVGIEAPVTTERVIELMKQLEFPSNLKIYYDTGNLYSKEDIYQTISKFGKQHFCEVHIKPAGHAVIGEGEIDLQRLAKALDEAEYDGWLVYEGNRQGREPVANLKGIQQIVSLRQ